MHTIELPYHKRDAYIVSLGLMEKNVIHTANGTRTIYECIDKKGREKTISFSNTLDIKAREEENKRLRSHHV